MRKQRAAALILIPLFQIPGGSNNREVLKFENCSFILSPQSNFLVRSRSLLGQKISGEIYIVCLKNLFQWDCKIVKSFLNKPYIPTELIREWFGFEVLNLNVMRSRLIVPYMVFFELSNNFWSIFPVGSALGPFGRTLKIERGRGTNIVLVPGFPKL